MKPGYYAWRAWRLSGGLPANRPAGLRKRIPPHWWFRLAIYNKLYAAPGLGPLQTLSALFDNPNGGIEDIEMMYRNGLRVWFLNTQQVGWAVIRALIDRQDAVSMPWQRCYTKQDVGTLIAYARSWGSPGIGLNYETSSDTSLTIDEIVECLKGYDGHVYLIVSPWMENDLAWKKLANRCVFVLEAFTNESDRLGNPYVVAQLVEHAHAVGARTVTVMAGIYPARHPAPSSRAEWLALGGYDPVILYLGDNLGPNQGKWQRWQ